jgi:hypothetical protein
LTIKTNRKSKALLQCANGTYSVKEMEAPKETTEAATRIQAVYRGYVARRKMWWLRGTFTWTPKTPTYSELQTELVREREARLALEEQVSSLRAELAREREARRELAERWWQSW